MYSWYLIWCSRSRRTIFAHYCKLGILVNCAKEMAITSGDRSGTFVHPVYIDFAQFYGCHTYRLVSSDWSLSDLELELEKRLRTALSEMDLRGVFDYAQAHLIIGLYLVFSEVTTATKYIKHATSIIEHNPHTFLPSLDNGPPPATPLEPSEEVQQRFALIAHLVNCRSLLRIHASEKTTKAVPGDVLNNLPVRTTSIRTSPHLSQSAGFRRARCFKFSGRTARWNIVESR